MDFTNHKEIEEKNIIEKYILNQLLDEEENGFEEHLLFCDQCRKEYNDLEKIIKAIEKKQVNEAFVKSNQNNKATVKSFVFSPSFKIAASIVLLIGISSLFYFLVLPIINTNNTTLTRKDNRIDTLKAINTVNKEKNQPDKYKFNEHTLNYHNKKELIAEVNKPNPNYENAIENQFRSPGLEVNSPIIAQQFFENEDVDFNWTSKEQEELFIVLFDNTGQMVFEKKINNQFTCQQSFKPGLYYWQLENDDEILFTGKFVIVRKDD